MKNTDYDTLHLTKLSPIDFKNPFVALEEIFKGMSAENMQDECWEVFTSAFRPNYWMKYKSPLVVYKKYKKILKLLEIGWLIFNIRPTYTTRGTISESFPHGTVGLNLSELEEQNKGLNSYKTLIQLYSKNGMLFYKLDLFDILLMGLNATCERGRSEVGFIVFEKFKEINALIKALHNILVYEKNKSITVTDLQILNQIEKQNGKMNGCYIFDSNLRDIIGKYTEKKDLMSVLMSSENLLYVESYWEWHNNPGNIIYYFHHFLFTLEIFWAYSRKVDKNSPMEKFIWQLPEDRFQELLRISKEEITKPWKYIKDKFRKKSIYEWRSDLKDWEEVVLSNKVSFQSHSVKVKNLRIFLGTLIEIADLIDYLPKIKH